MLNFDLINKGLMDKNLSDFAFRLLYYVANTLSVKQTTEIETYIPFLMEKFGWGRTKVKDTLRELVKAGYITKTMGKNDGNEKPIKIKVGAKYCTDSQKVSVTGDTEFGKSECQNEQKVGSPERPEFESGVADTTKVGSPERPLYNSTLTKYSSMDKKKPSGDEVRRYNEYIDQTFRTLEQRLNYYYTLKTPELCSELQKELTNIFKDAQEKKHYFTEAQWEKLCRYGDRWGKIEEGKLKYLNSDQAKTDISDEDDEPQEYNEIQTGISFLGEDSDFAHYGCTG